MRSGLHRILSCVPGVIRLWKGHRDVILWPVFAGKVSAICAASLGNPIIRIILNATFIVKSLKMRKTERKQCYKS